MSYYDDSRVISGLRRRWYSNLDERKQIATVIIEDGNEETEPEVILVHFEYEVCSVCGGTGVHVNPSIDANGLTYEDFDADPDFKNDYFNGLYDQKCNECDGKRVVPVMSKRNDPEVFKRITEQIKSVNADARERARELKYGY